MNNLPLPDYTPVFPVTKVVKPRQRSSTMPEWGIEQRATQGQNQTSPEWKVKWILNPSQANNLDAFLAERARAGEGFLWLPPSGASGTFRCDDWTKQLTACNIYEIQATFRQIFDIRTDAISDGFELSIVASLVAGVASTGDSDPDFSAVQLLLHFDGLEGGTSFIDNSATANTITRVGSPTITLTQAKFDGSGNFSGSGSWLTLSNTTWTELDGDIFTFECWFRPSSVSATHTFLAGKNRYNNFYAAYGFWFTQSTVGFDVGNGAVPGNRVTSAALTISANQWYHYACTRDSSGVMRVFIDGDLKVSATKNPVNASNQIGLAIGNRWTDFDDGNFVGWMDDLRMTVGVARYTANFTAPTTAFPDQ